MKPGRRALGIAASDRDQRSHLAGAVVRADRAVDGFVFGTCTVGGSDATAAVCDMFDRLDREDLGYIFLSGIAPAWFNLLDLHAIHDHTGLPTLSVSFETSPGLADAIRDAFDSDAVVEDRLATYHAQPDRRELSVNDDTVFVRSVGLDPDEAGGVVRAYTPTGGRPEPLRVARLAARAGAAERAER
ncbi:DUF99 family protein [Haloarcula salinisoli]|uniref:UPF0215 protein EGD98_11120 n=1 Tax=Haloarcula salinisoli TaxID=2487746 RepID=A0A8J7YIM4_9EURY|nr:DUF99 family protein [Halomicroarcula salinisoli]MBX0286916.1 DUF99 family protein [Halomicroarcula salinisoli]MBX0304218.1 DUF99 family protein [Halomicroarcula salinisoli]